MGDTAFFTGPANEVYAVPALEAGDYSFVCQVHPSTMTGTLDGQVGIAGGRAAVGGVEDDGAAGAPTGRTQTRGRAFFGLLDANGWGWASLKAAFWFILHDLPARLHPGPGLLLHRQPDDRSRASSPGARSTSARPRTRRCRARRRSARSIPWEVAPRRALAARAAGRRRRRPVRDQDPVHRRQRRDGRRPTRRSSRRPPAPATSTAGPTARSCPSRAPMPPSASRAAGSSSSAAPGRTASRPTPVFVLTPDSQTGELGEWQTAEDAELDLDLPGAARRVRSLVPAADGLFLVGGTADGTTPVEDGLEVDVRQQAGALQPWQPSRRSCTRR